MKRQLSCYPNAKLLPLCLLSIGIMLSINTYAASNPAEIPQQQDTLQQQEQQREQMQPQSDVRLDSGLGAETTVPSTGNTEEISNSASVDNHATGHTSNDTQSCFAIEQVALVGEHNHLFQFALKKALAQTHFQAGKCLNATDINQMMVVAQNAIISKGYTTTRVLAAPQDLSKQVMKFFGYHPIALT